MIVIFYVLIALFAALIVLKAYQKKNGSALMIGKVMLAVFLLILFYSLSLAAEVYSLKSFFSSLSFVMSDIMVIFFFEYILDFIDLNNKYLRALRMGFYAYAAIDSAFLLINPYKEIAVAYEMRSFYDITVLENYPKLPFIAHFFFSLCIVLLCIILLMVRCFNTPKVYRRRYYMLITGTIAAIFVNCIHFLMVETLPIDLSPILYCIIGMMMYYNTFRYLPMVTMGLTKTMILDHLNEPVILFDYEGRLADLSKSVPALFPEVDFSISDLMLDDFISENRFKGMRNKDINQEFEWSITRMGEITTYLCKYRRLTDEKGRLLGTMMVYPNAARTAMEEGLEEKETEEDLFGGETEEETEAIESEPMKSLSVKDETYEIVVLYTDEAGIPDGAQLEVTEILQGENQASENETENQTEIETNAAVGTNYEACLEKSREYIDEGSAITYARFFSIRIMHDGQEITPETPVTVNIYLTDVKDDVELNTVHLTEDSAEIIGTNTQEGISFETSGF